MKVLWFANTPSNYAATADGHNGGGWVSSLESEISRVEGMELAVVFATRVPMPEKTVGNVHYYPVFNKYNFSRYSRLRNMLSDGRCERKYLIDKYLSIVKDFKPDLIQIFGSEHDFGLVAKFTDIPVVLHIQGMMIPYFKVFLPPGMSRAQYIFESLHPSDVFGKLYTLWKWKNACRREKEIFGAVKYFMGRTAWDLDEMLKLNPEGRYFHVDEVLRDVFYVSGNGLRGGSPADSGQIGVKDCGDCAPEANGGIGGSRVFRIVTTISEPPYKGMDMILRAGKILREDIRIPFSWEVYGNVRQSFFEKFTGITCAEAGVDLKGVASAADLRLALDSADIYVHPSYIDNSPNGVCEAQVAGKAVVAAEVGGVPSLVDGSTGILVRPGDFRELARSVANLYRNPEMRRSMGLNAVKAAGLRHDKKEIVSSILEAYRYICNGQKE